MRVTIPHHRGKQQAKDAVSHAVSQVFTGLNLGAISFTAQRQQWSGDTLTFSAIAKMGFLTTPIRGSAVFTDSDVTLDLDLGLLGKLIPEEAARQQIERTFKGLLT